MSDVVAPCELLTIAETAALLHVAQRIVRRWLDAKRLAGIWNDEINQMMVPRENLRDFLKSGNPSVSQIDPIVISRI